MDSISKNSPNNMSLSNQPGTPRDDSEMGGNFLNPFQSESYSPSMTMSVWSITTSPHENHSESALHRTTREEHYSSQCTVKQRNLSHTKPTFFFPALSPILWRKRVQTWFKQLYGAAYEHCPETNCKSLSVYVYVWERGCIVYVYVIWTYTHAYIGPQDIVKYYHNDILRRNE